jgi:hypothetical protein
MKGGVGCSACRSPYLPTIDSMLQLGSRLAEISAACGLSKFVISRHKRHTLSAPSSPTEDSSQTLREQQISVWLSRADDLYIAAGLQNDVRSQVAAIGQALKGLEFDARRRGELLASQLTQANQIKANENLPFEKRPLTVGMLDEIVRQELRKQALEGSSGEHAPASRSPKS